MSGHKYIVGNWKMNGLSADSIDRTQKLCDLVKNTPVSAFKMVLCPPATQLVPVISLVKGSALSVGGQDCHKEASGAYTGNISAPMLADIGCTYVILGHSERRQFHNETDADVKAKAMSAHAAGLIAVICVGETEEQRDSGKANEIILNQLTHSIPDGATAENTIIAYEPIWAIGTGKTASPDDVKDMHATIRGKVGDLPLLYGGSVKPDNASDILHTPNVDGVLVGGASLKPDDFIQIAESSAVS